MKSTKLQTDTLLAKLTAWTNIKTLLKNTKKQRKLLNFGRNLECKAFTAALKSPLGCERPVEMPGLEK